MPQPTSSKEEKEMNVTDLTSHFTCVKLSTLRKVSKISWDLDPTILKLNSHNRSPISQTSDNTKPTNESSARVSNSPNDATTKPNNRILFSINKLQRENELQRKEEVEISTNRRRHEYEQHSRALLKDKSQKYSNAIQEFEERKAKELATMIAIAEQIAKQEENVRRSEQQLQAKEQKDLHELHKLIEKEGILEKIKLLTHHSNVLQSKCGEILSLVEKLPNASSVSSVLKSHRAKLTEVHEQLETLEKNFKNENISDTDLILAKTVMDKKEEFLQTLKLDLDYLSAQVSYMFQAEVTRQVQEQEEAAAAAAAAAGKTVPDNIINFVGVSEETDSSAGIGIHSTVTSSDNALIREEAIKAEGVAAETVTPSTPSCAGEEEDEEGEEEETEQPGEEAVLIDKESWNLYTTSQQYLQGFTQSYEDLFQSDNTKKLRIECQKAINIPVNAISGTSEQHLKDKYERLDNILSGRSLPNEARNPAAVKTRCVAFCKNMLAEKLISQAETLVSSKPKMAFPIAAIVVALWNDHSDFGQLFLSHLYKTCPFLVPVIMPQLEGQSHEEYYQSLGYKYSKEGNIEKQDKFLKRISGLMRLYASVIVTTQRRGCKKPHPHGLQNAWRWLAALLNNEQRPEVSDICATLMLDMLEVTSHALFQAYPNQFPKLLTLILNEYVPRIETTAIGGGPLVRLGEFLKEALSKGPSIAPPQGQLPSNIW